MWANWWQHLVTKSLSRVDSDSMQIMHKSFDWTSSELSSSITTKSGNGTVFNNSPSVYSLHDAHLDCRYSDIASSESSRHFDNKYSLGRFNPVMGWAGCSLSGSATYFSAISGHWQLFQAKHCLPGSWNILQQWRRALGNVNGRRQKFRQAPIHSCNWASSLRDGLGQIILLPLEQIILGLLPFVKELLTVNCVPWIWIMFC